MARESWSAEAIRPSRANDLDHPLQAQKVYQLHVFELRIARFANEEGDANLVRRFPRGS